MSRLSLLLDLAAVLAREVDLDALLAMACERIAEALGAERATVWLVDAETGELVTRVAVLPELPSLRQRMDSGISGHVARTGEVVRTDDVAADPRFDRSADRVTGYTTRSMLVVPIRDDADAPVRGVLQVLNKKQGRFDAGDERYVVALGMQLARALRLTTLRAADEAARGVVVRGPFNHVIGRSPAMAAAFERVARAASSDATVLLRGETGTGKGLLARAIHVNSARQAGPFVTVDCASLPAQLVESELFGHERGAFTGAERRVPGRVELAHGGTLFLDEIGELPPQLQGKLLRFLQERCFERVGGRETLHVDVRIVCATHRDLEEAVRRGDFRQDLYYRVKVVSIVVPPLRERGGDEIERLAMHFADLYARRNRCATPRLDPDVLAVLRAHSWPGNVRELEHWIESAVVLSAGGLVRVSDLPASAVAAEAVQPGPGTAAVPRPGQTLADAMASHARATLEACGGNRSEASRRLGIGRNRLARLLGARARPRARPRATPGR
jgi:Nif-specific regulatory protein